MKVGILSLYYGSDNYGGVLQAYALTNVIRSMGYDAEQICFPLDSGKKLSEDCIVKLNKQCASQNNDNRRTHNSVIINGISIFPKKVLEWILAKIDIIRRNHIEKVYFIPRREAFRQFRDNIPHSESKYTTNTMFMLNEKYDAFITGSDQVWNFRWHKPECFLEFVDANKKRIAYAVSAGNSKFDTVQKKYLVRTLPKFHAISVREIDLVEKYKTISNKDVEFVLDPVFLLKKDEWDKVSSETLVPENYLFCFFYSPTEKIYELARNYADLKGLKIVTIPFAGMLSRFKMDDKFGDFKIGNASPNDFISLVKHADCVFTDSFHCNAFSIIYDRPFFVFGRDGMNEMNSRIISLSKMFSCEERFCDVERKQTIKYIDSISKKKYFDDDYQTMIYSSIEFLKKSLEG